MLLPVSIKTQCFSWKGFFSVPLSPPTFLSSSIISLKNISLCLWLFGRNFEDTGNISVYSQSQLANKKVRLKKQTFSWILHYKKKFRMVWHPLTLVKSIREWSIELVIPFLTLGWVLFGKPKIHRRESPD